MTSSRKDKPLVDYATLPPTALTPAEAEWLAQQAALLQDDPVIVHLGVDRGASLLCSLAGNPTAVLVGVDTNLKVAAADLGMDVELIEADSRTIDWRGPVDFLFVDADHAEGSVLADILNWHRRISEGGVIAFHDYGHANLRWCAGVKAAVDAWDWTGWQEIAAPDSIKAFVKLGSEGQNE